MCVSKAIYIGPVVHVQKKKKIDVCGVHKINTFTQKKRKKKMITYQLEQELNFRKYITKAQKSHEAQNLCKTHKDKQHFWTWIRFKENGGVKMLLLIRILGYIKKTKHQQTN